MNVCSNIIIGSGMSGLGAAYALSRQGKDALVLEKDSTYGGLAGNFTIADGYRFDRFVHFTFSADKTVNDIFDKSTGGEIIRHTPNPYNIYKRKWVKHPAQNNLFPLDEDEKAIIIEDFRKRRECVSTDSIADYETWLRIQYGDAFAERFPMVYTKKYWMVEASELGTAWVGNRMYRTTVEEVIRGAETADTPLTYYAKEMRYPAKGGFKQLLSYLVGFANIVYNCEVTAIDPVNRIVRTTDNRCYRYDNLYSSMPLPMLIKALGEYVPDEVWSACGLLKCTCGYQVSIALRNENIPPYLWFYIYDKDILPARVYSPSLKSPDNAPAGCSSLQLEVYCEENQYTEEELYEKSVKPLIEMGVINLEDIVAVDIRFEKWANVIFDHNIYAARDKVLCFVRSIGIIPIGRFGLWDYLWSDQALLSGINAV